MNIVGTFCVKEKCKEFSTPCGQRFREQFVGKLDKETGIITLVSVGKVDQYAEIQSHADEADIQTLIARATAGDLSVFKSAVFGDSTVMPETYADALNLVIEAEREFNHLPQTIKDKFDNDWHKYITSAGTEEWYNKFRPEKEKAVSNVKEISEDEQKQ